MGSTAKRDSSPLFGRGADKSSALSTATSALSQAHDPVLANLSNQKGSDENLLVPASIQQMTVGELQKDLTETKDKLKVITQKFVNVRKERDQLKQENKELQEEVLQL